MPVPSGTESMQPPLDVPSKLTLKQRLQPASAKFKHRYAITAARSNERQYLSTARRRMSDRVPGGGRPEAEDGS